MYNTLVFVCSQPVPCWTLEQINDEIYTDSDTNQDGALDAAELDVMLAGWGIVSKIFCCFKRHDITGKVNATGIYCPMQNVLV